MTLQDTIQNQFSSQSRVLTLFLGLLAVIAVLHPLVYFGTFSGDAEIHLVYARNFLNGYPLQFNPGEPSSGQTSMGFMFILVPIMKLFGEAATPLAMKLIGIFSLYVIAAQTWRLGTRLGLAAPWPLVAAVTTLLLPGSVFNGVLGSENAFFGALALTWILLALQSGWLTPERPPSLGRDALLGMFMGAMFWIRPETIPFGAIAWTVRGAADIAAKKRLDPRMLGHGVLFGAIAAGFVLAYVLIFRAWTGILPFGAGYARLIESINVDSVWVAGLAINVKVLLRLGAYASIVAPALYALVVVARRMESLSARWLLLFLGAEFFGLMTAYCLNAVTALHFARYTIFAWPLGVLAAACGLQRLSLSQNSLARLSVIAAVIGFLGMAVYETKLRSEFLHETLESAMSWQPLRIGSADRYLQELGNPAMRPVVIAAQEVQIRNYLDDRFVIRSLDGILDIAYLQYLCHGYNDHDGYFIDQKVDFLLAPFSNYNHDRKRWSINRFEEMAVGQSVERPGIRYTKIGPGTVRITRLVTRAADRTIQPCRIDASSPYF